VTRKPLVDPVKEKFLKEAETKAVRASIMTVQCPSLMILVRGRFALQGIGRNIVGFAGS
jgi:hypothetical protein